ncbi:hypothetical protein XENTR_v10012142 [Xenopus tropicalis]|nr:hypothetical protein XENTR_v10012142 [Xenopus tropicalis]
MLVNAPNLPSSEAWRSNYKKRQRHLQGSTLLKNKCKKSNIYFQNIPKPAQPILYNRHAASDCFCIVLLVNLTAAPNF